MAHNKGRATIERVKNVFHKVTKEGKAVSAAMLEAGYAPAYAKNPHDLTRSKTWLELLDKAGISDRKLAETHNALLNDADARIRLSAVDMGYKVKGKYSQAGGTTFNAPVQINIAPIKPSE